MENDDFKRVLIGFITAFLMVCGFVIMIFTLVEISSTPSHDKRTWEQKYKDKAFHDCQWGTSDPVKIEKCYVTVYGAPNPNYTPAK